MDTTLLFDNYDELQHQQEHQEQREEDDDAPTINPEVARKLVVLGITETTTAGGGQDSHTTTARATVRSTTTSSRSISTKRINNDTSKAISELLRLFIVEAHQRASLHVSCFFCRSVLVVSIFRTLFLFFLSCTQYS